VDPAPGDHRRDHGDRPDPLRRDVERIAVQHHEVGGEARREPSQLTLPADRVRGAGGEAGDRLGDGERMFGTPRRAVVQAIQSLRSGVRAIRWSSTA